MIFEPDSDHHYACWVDGYLPLVSELEKLIDSQSFCEITRKVSDSQIVTELGKNLRNNYSEIANKDRKKPQSYIHIFKPEILDSPSGIVKPIHIEYNNMSRVPYRRQYRLLAIFSKESIENKEYDVKSLKKSFLMSINCFNINTKENSTYKHLDYFKNQLQELSNYIFESYFLPFGLIKNNLKNIGISSEDDII